MLIAMIAWVRRIHMYAGLLNFSILVIFGMAGLVVTFHAPDIMHSGVPPRTSSLPFTAPRSVSDPEMGRLIAEHVGTPPHSGPPYVHRDGSNRLLVDFYSVNGLVRATLIESENRIELQTYRNSIWRFVDNVHAATIADRAADTALRAWTWYIEFSIWSLIAMCVTGVWLAVALRWSFTWTRAALAAGALMFAIFYVLER